MHIEAKRGVTKENCILDKGRCLMLKATGLSLDVTVGNCEEDDSDFFERGNEI